MADQVPLMGDFSRQTGRLMYLNGLAGMPLSMDDDEKQAPEPGMLDGGAAAGQDDAQLAQMEQELEQGGVKGDGVPSSPLNVTPLSTRTAGLGQPPNKTEQVLGLLSDVAAGALAGSQFKSRPGTALRGGGVSPGLAATLGGFAGIQAGEQNRIQREVRRRAFDQQDFQRQQALYIAELNQAKYNRTEDRLDAQANAVKAHYRLMEQKARIDGKKLLLEMKNGTIKVIGNNAWRFWPDGRSEQITNTEQGAKAVSIKMWKQQAKVMGLSEKETNQGILKILNPSFKTDVEIATENKKEFDKPENVEKRTEAASKKWAREHLALLGGNYQNAIYRMHNLAGIPGGIPDDVDTIRIDKWYRELAHQKKLYDKADAPEGTEKPKTHSEVRQEANDKQDAVNKHAAAYMLKTYHTPEAAAAHVESEDFSQFQDYVEEAEVLRIINALIKKPLGGGPVVNPFQKKTTTPAPATKGKTVTPVIPKAADPDNLLSP